MGLARGDRVSRADGGGPATTEKQKISPAVAEAILADFRGPGYYRDPKLLAGFLEGQYGRLPKTTRAAEVAEAILADLQGAAYYQDARTLADFLQGNFERA